MSEHVRPDVLSALVDGECGPEEQRWAHSHLRDCAECRSVADGLAAVSDLLSGLPRLAAPPEVVDGALSFPGRRPRLRWVAAAAAAVAVGVSLGGLAAPAERTEPPVEVFMTRHVGVNHSSQVGGQVLFAVHDR